MLKGNDTQIAGKGKYFEPHIQYHLEEGETQGFLGRPVRRVEIIAEMKKLKPMLMLMLQWRRVGEGRGGASARFKGKSLRNEMSGGRSRE
jgi:hypothetical protein